MKIAALLSLVMLSIGAASLADPLQPGSDALGCMNLLLPGAMSPCSEQREPLPIAAPSAPPAPRLIPPVVTAPAPLPSKPAEDVPKQNTPSPERHPAVSVGGITEKEVDDYLSSWGKPPREAVRALLNPTEENIRALVDRHKRDEVVRNYMAGRMAQMVIEQNPRTPTTPRDSYLVLPRLVGLQMTLYVTPECPTCDEAIANMKQLALEYPIVSTRVIVITESELSLVQIMLRWQLTLPTSTMTSAQARERRLTLVPLFEVVDSRTQQSVRLSGVRKPLDIVNTALTMRKASTPDAVTSAPRGDS